jgi:hypothetical protein
MSSTFRARLQLLINEWYGGNKSEFGRAIGGVQSSQVGQWLIEPGRPGQRNISVGTLLEIEDKVSLPRGWFKSDDPLPQKPSISLSGTQDNKLKEPDTPAYGATPVSALVRKQPIHEVYFALSKEGQYALERYAQYLLHEEQIAAPVPSQPTTSYPYVKP